VLGVAAAVLLAIVLAFAIAICEAGRTDANGFPLARYQGVYNQGAFVEIVYRDGWVFFHSVDRSRGEVCGIGRNAPGGLEAAGYRLSLAPTGRALFVNGVAFAARPDLVPTIDAMWNLDAKAMRLASCKPNLIERARLIALALSGSR